ncbi:hypothetical protein LWI28_008052 [Acer negundo]|uniref:Uncharacterized protein n=1 Tax=Acer negundo TaxID=4023 RepID=A0AAD5NZR1_ACENE|nr:hypothetical protein LWI28_008052 [Acer negundo]
MVNNEAERANPGDASRRDTDIWAAIYKQRQSMERLEAMLQQLLERPTNPNTPNDNTHALPIEMELRELPLTALEVDACLEQRNTCSLKISVIKTLMRTLRVTKGIESLGYIDINLNDVVYNGRIKEKYHLINLKYRVLHVEMLWKAI